MANTHMSCIIIVTGSIYCDRILRGSGFDGEKIQSSSVLVTKEHLRVPHWTHTRNAHEFMSKVHIMAYSAKCSHN